MQQDALNRLRMLRTTAAQLEELNVIWEANPMMQVEDAQLRQLIIDIEQAHAKTLAAPGKAQRDVARIRKETAIEALTTLVNVTRTWAERVGGEEVLVQRLSVRPYMLRTLPEAELIARLEELHTHCIAARPGIQNNPLTTSDYLHARTCMDAFLNMQDAARKSDIARQGENDHLAELFKQVTPVLKRIDRLMENYKTRHPVEFAKYRASRTVYDYGNPQKRPGTKAGEKPQQQATGQGGLQEPQTPKNEMPDAGKGDAQPPTQIPGASKPGRPGSDNTH